MAEEQMNLVNDRNRWKKGFSDGKTPAFLKEYRDNRNSEQWRSSGFAEELCEYILYLEASKDTLRMVIDTQTWELNRLKGEVAGLRGRF